ncbi:MAG: group II truncated hemoglobin [Burkholderiales bacterium]|nr:group II truncated hemoglobin [Burkholderiales bacterium]
MSTDLQQPQPNPDVPPYQLIGGEEKVRALVDRFYDLMDEDPDYFGIRKLHPASLDGSRDKLFMFLSGWLGGPPLYVNEFGHPRLRARHLPFPIATSERDQWLACMNRAMEDTGIELRLRQALARSFFGTADWMRNQEG